MRGTASIPSKSSQLIALLASWLGAHTAHAYPIPPSTIWELADQSDLIVLAAVVEDGREARERQSDDDWAPARARLAVREVWKGHAGGTIDVAYEPFLVCPAPPRFLEGETVLAFLGWEADEGFWYVPELSYGTRYPTGDDVAAYRSLVRNALFLRQSRAAENGPPLDWLVTAASRRGTRWDGLFGLAARFDALHSFYDRGTERVDLRGHLSKAQLARIARGFDAEPSVDVTFPMTLGVLAGVSDERFDRAALGVFEGVLRREEAPYWIASALRLLLERVGDPSVEQRLAKLAVKEFSTPGIDDVRRLWREAKLALALPDVEPIVPEEDGVWGVGGRTPD